MHDFRSRIIPFFLILFCTVAHGQEANNQKNDVEYENVVRPLLKSLENMTDKKLKSINNELSELKSKSESNVKVLEDIIDKQGSELKELKAEIRKRTSNDEMTFEEWAGILLASVAIILTTLAVVIAIVSFYGYRKIINSANEIATQKSTEVTRKTVEEQIKETTQIELVSLFKGGKLDEFLLDAAGKVIYRGISRAHYNGESDDVDEGEGEE